MAAITVGGHQVSSLNLSNQWGLSPASGTITAVGDGTVREGDEVSFTAGGFTFEGEATAVERRVDEGTVWTITVTDFRRRLQDDCVYGFFNRPEIIEDDWTTPGIDRKKRYVHLYPENYDTYKLTRTDSPHTAKEILQRLFTAPTVRHTWSLQDHPNLAIRPREIDCETGKELANALQEICDECRIIVGIEPGSKLRFTVQGEGAVPPFPANSRNRVLGQATAPTPTKLRVVGDRNLYQRFNIPLEPGWNRNWESFWGELQWLAKVEQWFGPFRDDKASLAQRAALSRSVTVRQVVEKAGASYADYQLWGEVSRMEIPAWIYLQDVVFKAYRIPRGLVINKTELVDTKLNEGLLVAVKYNASNGQHLQSDERDRFYPETKAFITVQGQPLSVWDPTRGGDFEPNLLQSARSRWQANQKFDLDGNNYGILFHEATFRDGVGAGGLLQFPNENISGLDDDLRYLAVPNGNATIEPAVVLGTFAFAAERYAKDFGAGRRADTVYIPGLRRDVLMNTGVEVVYKDGETADQKAKENADLLLERPTTILSGGYDRIGEAGTTLTGAISRVSVKIDFSGGLSESVSFSNETGVITWDSERELERNARSKELFPGQERNRDEVRQLEETAQHLKAASRREGAFYANLGEVQMKPTINTGANSKILRLSTGPSSPLLAGTPIWRASDGAVGLTGDELVGISIPFSVDGKDVPVARQGLVPARVRGPFRVGDRVGCKATDSAESAESFASVAGIKGIGTVMANYDGTSVVVVPVSVQAGKNARLGFETFLADESNVSIWPSFVFGLDVGAVIPKMNDFSLISNPTPKIALRPGGWVGIFIEVEPTTRAVTTWAGDTYEIIDGGGTLVGEIIIKTYADSAEMNDDARPAAIDYATGSVTNTGRFVIPLARRNPSGSVEHLGHFGPIGVRLCSNGGLSVAGATRAIFDFTENLLP